MRLSNRHVWSTSDAAPGHAPHAAQLQIPDSRPCSDWPAGLYPASSSLAVWEVMLLLRSYTGYVTAVAKHLRWPRANAEVVVSCASAFPEEIGDGLAENSAGSNGLVFALLMVPHCQPLCGLNVLLLCALIPTADFAEKQACAAATVRWSSTPDWAGRNG